MQYEFTRQAGEITQLNNIYTNVQNKRERNEIYFPLPSKCNILLIIIITNYNCNRTSSLVIAFAEFT
uniref:MIP20310p n=1 Tax=Drosophila melanogaster TaxID=7227 RepID=D6W4W7_DROME|nr:MIP20310p [Drosophila melanogaster]